MEDLDAASLEDVGEFFRTYYAPNNAVLSVVGDVDRAEVRRYAEQYFGGIAANPSIPPLGDLTPPAHPGRGAAARPSRIGSRCRASTSASARRRSATPRFDALEVGAQILAGGKGSRLHRRLVRDEQIAQDVVAFALGFVGGASIAAGWATVRPGVEVERVEAAYEEELERLGREAPSDDEIARARALIETGELSALQQVDERADRLSMYATLFDDPELINRQLQRYLDVTAEQVREAAAAVFRADNRVVLTYLPQQGGAEAPRPRARRSQRDRRRRHEAGRRHAALVRVPVRLAHPSRRTASSSASRTCPADRSSSAALLVRRGAVDEPAEFGGATILAARALTEGTERYDAVELVEAAERLGASLHAEASWDAMSAAVDVPSERLEAGLELLAEVIHRPTFPAREVDRLRDERLNDLLQARADPRRRADEAFTDTIYTAETPYHRPAGGTDETVRRLDRSVLEATYRAALDPSREPRSSWRARSAASTSRASSRRLFGSFEAPAPAARRARSWPNPRCRVAACASSTARARSRASCASATWASRADSATTTRSRSPARSWAACSTAGST